MAKYLGNTGLSRLWTKYKQRYLLKTNELGSTTYTYSESSPSAIAITVNIITTHSGTTDTLTCALSQAVDVNLLFKLTLSGSNRRYFVIFAGKTSVTFTETGVTGNASLQNISSVLLVDELDLASKYTFTISTQLLVGSSFEHVLYLASGSVDWHAMTLSGTLTRSTTASTKPKINTYLTVSKWDGDDLVYYNTGSVSVNASSNTATISNAALSATTGTLSYEGVIPTNATFATTASGHYITTQARSYTGLIADVGITINSWSQTNLRPTLVWYRSSGDCVYSGTLPTATVSFTNIVAGDTITLQMFVYYDPADPDSGDPYTIFTTGKNFSSSGTFNNQTMNFHDAYNGYVGIDSNDTAYTCKIYMNAYLTNTSKNMYSQYIGSWPSSTGSSITGAFTKVFSAPPFSTRPYSSNTGLFGQVTLDGRLW